MSWHFTVILTFNFFLIFVYSVPVSFLDTDNSKCGYQACHPTKEGYINIHLVPHSHDDVGWVKTVEQFYYGLNNNIYAAGVQFIYDSTLASLKKSKDRKFIWVETAYFWKWWQEQNEDTRNDVKRLVNHGQIEFVGGGWSMNDEAVTTYQSIIDQMTWGLRRLNDTFGKCAIPKMGWQIDPFGHSSEMASIFAAMGYDGVLLGRIDYQDQEKRLLNRTMEMVWRGSESLGAVSDIFTGVLFDHYDAPDGFNFGGSDEPLVDDPNSVEFNIEEKTKYFLQSYVNEARSHYITSNVLVPMGSDFAYQNAEMWYASMDKLIKYINSRTFDDVKYNIIYSTPSCYLHAVHKETKGKVPAPLKTDDFFPYASDPFSYWTGFYTSRPTLKRFERIGNSYLQSCKQLAALTNLTSEEDANKISTLREAMGVMQHHDAITGTEKEVVAYDYAVLLSNGIKKCEEVASKAISKLTHHNSTFKQCLLTNISQCDISEKQETFVVTVHNILSRPINKYVRLPVNGNNFHIQNHLGHIVPWQLVPVPKSLKSYPGRQSNATHELLFECEDIPPLGFKSYFVRRIDDSADNNIYAENINLKNEVFEVRNDNQNMSLFLNTKRGTLEKLTMNNIHMEIHQNFLFYNGSNGMDNEMEINRPSGAYIFRPDINHPIKHFKEAAQVTIYTGDLVTEIHQEFKSWISQVIKIYKNRNYVEFNWMVGPLPFSDPNGKEVITRFTTNLKTNATFYTDSNSRGLLKRVRDYRPTWNLQTNESASANYYPITSEISMIDDEKDIGVVLVTDRSQGGSSLSDGELEVMLHRNAVNDDSLGVDEALMETAYNQGAVARGQIFLMIGRTKNTTDDGEKLLQNKRHLKELELMDAQIFLSVPEENNFEDYNMTHGMEFQGITNSLPKNVHIMTLEPWHESSYLLRLEHLYEKNDHLELSKPAVVNLKELFTTFDVVSIKETTLGANQWADENQRLKFIPIEENNRPNNENYEATDAKEQIKDYEINLNPQQIRTFVVYVKSN